MSAPTLPPAVEDEQPPTPRPGVDRPRLRLSPHGRVARMRRWSIRFDLRVLVVVGAIAGVALLVSVAALGSGESPIAASDVVRSLVGLAEPNVEMIVVEWRLPRVLLGLMIGAALGVGGAVFQSLSRNPLGSPDIIGFTTGAATGALVVILVLEGGYYERASGALIGGVATALAVYVFAYKNGIQGFRFVLVGIAVSAMLASVNSYLILQAEISDAMAAATWQVGSLNGLGWEQVLPLSLIFVVLFVAALLLGRPMRMLEMGDDTARSLGVSAEPLRLGLILTGVGLTAAATAVAGPIAFVSLAAPQLAQRLTRSPGLSIVPSAAMGALLLVTSDWAAQRLFAPTPLPVGVMTVSIGGLYLVWLLARERKRGRA